MPRLRELQGAFFAALERGAAGDDRVDPALLAVVDGGGTLDAAARVGIYAEMYWTRIAAALAEDFPRVAALLGDARFHRLARAYVACTPSRHPSLRHAGSGFADFLAARFAREADAESPGGGDVPPFLADLARLEWARVGVFDAPDATVLTLDDLRGLAPDRWPDLRLHPTPAALVLELGWPVHEIWAAADSCDDGCGRAGDVHATIAPSPTALRVWRADTRVYQTALDATERAALAALWAEGTFGDVCEAVAAATSPARAAEEAGALLLRWIDDGLLAAPAP